MNSDTLTALETKFQKHSVMVAGPVSANEIEELETSIGFSLPPDYRSFVERFGGAIVGPYSVFGLRASEAMGDDESSALDVTKNFRDQRWPGTENWIVVSMDHAGNPFGLDKEGHVFISDHDAGVVEKVSDNFESFIRSRCLKLAE